MTNRQRRKVEHKRKACKEVGIEFVMLANGSGAATTWGEINIALNNKEKA